MRDDGAFGLALPKWINIRHDLVVRKTMTIVLIVASSRSAGSECDCDDGVLYPSPLRHSL